MIEEQFFTFIKTHLKRPYCEVKWKSLSRVWLFLTPWSRQSTDSPGQNTRAGSSFPSPGNFPNPEIELPQFRQIPYQLSHKGSPRILEWLAYTFSSGSSRPRNGTRVSCIAGRFFTSWVTTEAPERPYRWLFLKVKNRVISN